MSQTAVGEFNEDNIVELSNKNKEPEWLKRFRLESFQAYANEPIERSPLYSKYTNVSKFEVGQYASLAPIEKIDFRTFFEGYLTGTERNIILQYNATEVHLELDPELLDSGIELSGLNEAIGKHERLLKDLLESRLQQGREKYAALTDAFFNSGMFLYVPDGVRTEKPIRRMLLVQDPKGAIIEQNIIISGEDASATFLEELYSKGSSASYLLASSLEVRAGNAGNADVSTIQLLDSEAVYVSNKRLITSNDSKVTASGIFLGSSITRSRMNAVLEGRGSTAEGFEIFFCDDNQRYDFESNLLHHAPNTTGSTQARGVLKDESQSIFKGMIKIVNAAKSSNSYLAHHAMLLDKKARSDGIPSLEIDTNEVKATHSASVAQIDEEQLFYLMARGLERDEARKMIVLGFFEPVIEKIPIETTREGARFIIEGKWKGEKRRLVDRETLIALTGEAPLEARQTEDIFERHYKYRA
jgi:Fe-S cluster assembly protein SufB/Fe-S cluster assembly protein SufD